MCKPCFQQRANARSIPGSSRPSPERESSHHTADAPKQHQHWGPPFAKAYRDPEINIYVFLVPATGRDADCIHADLPGAGRGRSRT